MYCQAKSKISNTLVQLAVRIL